jgi:putative ABC transport system ATP-binding protein
MEAIRAEHVTKRYGEGDTLVRALTDVSLTLSRGRVVALLGPSGSGKSTLIKALGLVTVPDEGRIWMDGRLVVSDGEAVEAPGSLRRKFLGFVFQKANLIPFLTARQNVEIACEIGGEPDPRARTSELLDYLEIGHRASSLPDALSGGEQQRVAIARALANRPALILADEPTAALDKARGRAVMELFRRVAHEQGAAVLVVTHDHRTLDVFDATHEMEDGRLKLEDAGQA